MPHTTRPHPSTEAPTTAPATPLGVVLAPSTLVPLIAVWLVVAASVIVGPGLLGDPVDPPVAAVSFVVILAAIVVAAFRVVHEAEHLARALGEPFGTLILTLSIVIIEVILIASVMLGPGESTTIARDSLFAVMMIIINGVLGAALLVGGLRHGPQRYNREGTAQYLGMIVVFTLLALVLPNATTSAAAGSFSDVQAVGVAVLAAAAYATFLGLQTTKNRELFTQPSPTAATMSETTSGAMSEATTGGTENESAAHPSRSIVITHSALLVVTVLPIVLLSHDLATLLDVGIALLGAPATLSGVLIALIVFTPEAVTAIRASLGNETQRTINLGLGAFVSTVGLTLPAVLVIGLITGETVVLGESAANTVLIAATLALSIVTFTSKRTNALHGVAHLVLFGVFALLIFSP
ncbi:calcium:proton antiporter [Frigoribacterium sp. CFBP9039]|uniref:calcium:proton antiporter n=1 Tax=Frigoribacterium sp. CFBP9029 TaxID=3096541 RepID=UPI002A6AA939|nr:calcium:proton antiporter [Frigoribacterium sp. CFBP9039]MDY0946833.1 calcium:proton antiporter [Frigoribacterium sp. CFBP9039]